MFHSRYVKRSTRCSRVWRRCYLIAKDESFFRILRPFHSKQTCIANWFEVQGRKITEKNLIRPRSITNLSVLSTTDGRLGSFWSHPMSSADPRNVVWTRDIKLTQTYKYNVSKTRTRNHKAAWYCAIDRATKRQEWQTNQERLAQLLPSQTQIIRP